MSVRIEVEKSGNNVVLRSPEHPQLAERASALGGKVKGGAWTFAGAKESDVRGLAKDLWGTDGKSKDFVTLRVELSLFGEGPLGRMGEAWLCGRLLARRKSHDAPVELGPDVKVVAGSFSTWGGSPGRPALGARYGTTVDVAGVPRGAAEAAEKEYPLEVKITDANAPAIVGAWSRPVTERRPGPVQSAAAKFSAAGSSMQGGASQARRMESTSARAGSDERSSARQGAAAERKGAGASGAQPGPSGRAQAKLDAKAAAMKPGAAKKGALKAAAERASKPAKKAAKKTAKPARKAAKATTGSAARKGAAKAAGKGAAKAARKPAVVRGAGGGKQRPAVRQSTKKAPRKARKPAPAARKASKPARRTVRRRR